VYFILNSRLLNSQCAKQKKTPLCTAFIYLRFIEKVFKQSTTMSDEKKGGESEHINLKVLGQDNAVVQFKIKKHTPLRKLMNAYCDRAGLSMQVVRFRFDGQAINENDTPTSLEMEEGDTIEVYQQQTGGDF